MEINPKQYKTKGYVPRPKTIVNCSVCGKETSGNKGIGKCKYCQRRNLEHKVCKNCGIEYIGHRDTTFCCLPCAMAYRCDSKAVKECQECQTEFVSESRAMYCSRKCCKRNRDRIRRYRKRNCLVDKDITTTKVAALSGGFCKICNQPVDMTLPYTDPMGATIDHIHPISKGGLHKWDNVQLAHLVCNLQKGAKT